MSVEDAGIDQYFAKQKSDVFNELPDVWTKGKDEECSKDAANADCIDFNGLHDRNGDANEETIRKGKVKGGRMRETEGGWNPVEGRGRA